MSAFAAAPSGAPSSPKTTWIPMSVGMSRAFVSLEFTGPSGKSRTGTCWLDTGGGDLLLRRDFARELGLHETGKAVSENGSRLVPIEAPRITASTVSVPVPSSDAMMLDSERMQSGVEADALFPVRLLRDHAVTFDYPARRFGLDIDAPPGTVIPLEIAPHSGFARLPVTIGGETAYVLLDSGASCTMLSQAYIDKLHGDHPDWRTVRGAYDDANMLGGTFEAGAQELLLPSLDIAGFSLTDVVAVSRPEGTFEHWMSSLTSGPIIGSLGGNVLRNFHMTIDYPNAKLYLDYAGHETADHMLTLVALTVTANDDGSYDIAQMLDVPAYAALRPKLVGTHLVAIDGVPVNGRRISDVHELLHGILNTSKRITVSHDGRSQSYDVPVVSLWEGGA